MKDEEYCASADCGDKKMARKCMMTCEMCPEMEGEHEGEAEEGEFPLVDI